MKNILLQLLIRILALLFAVPYISFAASSPRVSLSQDLGNIADDDVLQINVKISNTAGFGIAGYSLRLDYDDKVLTNPRAVIDDTLSIDNADLFQSSSLHPPPDGIGKYSIGIRLANVLNQAGTNILIKIKFEVSPAFTCERTSYVRFMNTEFPDPKTNLFDHEYNEIDTEFTDCVIYPVNPFSGDVDGNKTVDLADAMIILQILAGKNPANIQDLSDYNCNDRIGMKNVLYIMRYFSEN
ncbi:hypothetical protein QUF76_00555 [Desulfobacterales bacterium HSG16]|nr:hypothetical protein [Desulfobacterales bacterium HSG16]